MSQTYIIFWNTEEHEKLRSWWSSLSKNPGWRAELRRAESPPDVLLCQGFRSLCKNLAGYWTREENLLGLAAVAGILSHVKADAEQSFAKSCATPEKEKAPVSELRFSQLQKSRTIDEFYIRMVRTIHLLDNKANVVSVADNVLHWIKEMVNGETDPDPRKRILVRWGLEYFQNLPQGKGEKS